MLTNLAGIASYGQCTIIRDSTGQISTICQNGKTTIQSLGSEFLTFPRWQNGAMVLGSTGREINCQICYNVYTNQIFCQLDDSTTIEVSPDAFTINGAPFIKQSLDGSARHNIAYYLIRYEGKTKLLEGLKCTFESLSYLRMYSGTLSSYTGQYKKQSSYYIQTGSDKLKLINLTKGSLLAALHERAEPLKNYIRNDKLTMHEVIDVLAYYDSLMTMAPVSNTSLNDDLMK